MAAPASSGPRWRIPIVIPQPYVVPPQAVRVGVPVNQTHEVNGASSSFEDARVRGFREGIEYQRNGGNRMAAKADDHGHGGGHGGIPEGAKKVLYWAAAILAIVWVLLYSADRIHQFWDPVGYRAAERARLLDERLDLLARHVLSRQKYVFVEGHICLS